MQTIRKLLVVGAGAMGSQIAVLGALGGLEVQLQDVRPEGLDAAQLQLTKRLGRMVEKGTLSQDEFDATFDRLRFTTDLAAAADGADLVIEAIVEKLEAKVDLFAQLSPLVRKDTIFATNSSSIVGSLIGDKTDRPQLFCNMHFFNPPLVMDCVEVVGGPTVDADTIDLVRRVCVQMNRTPIVLEKEIPGFIANRILNALFREAIALHEGGYASIDAIDDICRRALRHPMGPFELLDMAGIDVNLQMQDSFFNQSGDPADRPQDVIRQLVAENRLGQKTGKGFYAYEDGKKSGVAS
ncbi:3-hydroxyacyl-CoA dehydrogenase family protein [Rhodococcus opacus]|uniref:3-hydroxyacyl-CoA dehydrogenase family protein n=1 Tax=Rhodococcus opacus TaxID=37919 RepID=UPI001C44B516|nr:3-hydroxyacyl-CoA dehydrogenase family protein [Rhodococcus opacus]MBV6760232.1 3-hydroxyacyl-CoA dehydrogenase family protein [Rhodococcus opacus]